MRIGVMGKGGSGKTTITALLTRLLARSHFVIAVDADQNAHLGEALSMRASKNFSELDDEIKTHVLGGRQDVKKEHFIATTPPSMHSRFIHPTKKDPFLQKHATIKNNIALIQAGRYEETDVGSTCYHGKLEPIEIFYHHLLDTQDDYVVADSTAGMDCLGHSIFMVHDTIIYVVEPTKKSISVCKEFSKIAQQQGLNILVVGNKCMSEQDQDFIEQELGNVIAFIPFSENIKAFEQGDKQALDRAVDELQDLLEQILEQAKTKKNWTKYYELLLSLHKTGAQAWYDSYHNHKVSEQLDPEFSYEKVMKQ